MADHKHKDHNEDYMHCLVSLKVLGPKQGDSDAGVTESHEQQRQEETQGKLTAWHHSYHMWLKFEKAHIWDVFTVNNVPKAGFSWARLVTLIKHEGGKGQEQSE